MVNSWYPATLILNGEPRGVLVSAEVTEEETSMSAAIDLTNGYIVKLEDLDDETYFSLEIEVGEVGTEMSHENWEGLDLLKELAFPRRSDAKSV